MQNFLFSNRFYIFNFAIVGLLFRYSIVVALKQGKSLLKNFFSVEENDLMIFVPWFGIAIMQLVTAKYEAQPKTRIH